MRSFLLAVGLIISNPTFAFKTCADIDNLSVVQKFNLAKSYQYGEVHELGYTLAAIALTESQAGKWRLNIRSNDLGLFQINATTAQNTLKVEGYYDRLALHERLIYDDRLGAEIAIATLMHFRRNRVITNAVWVEMIKSYNEGTRWRRDSKSHKKASKYAEKISSAVRLLKKCEESWK